MMTDDLISRKSVLDWLSPYLHIGERVDPEALVEDIRQIKAVDAVPVVRCRECKYHNKPPCPMRLSFNWTEDDDFCSYGERKEGAD